MSYESDLAMVEGYAERLGGLRGSVEEGEQGSVTWLLERVGHCTASRFKDVLDFTKAGKEGAKRRAYRLEVLVERLTGAPVEHYVNAAMQHGIDHEPRARIAYEAHTGAMVQEVGFQHHPTVKWCGGSVDGLIDEDGMIEIKAPTSGTHLTTLLTGECEHLPQIQGYLWITGRAWCDFVSFDPRMPEGLKLYVQRIERDEAFIAELAAQVHQFLDEVQQLHDAVLQIAKRTN